MEEFFPSEIARLVLGYLDEMKCRKSWTTFIKESSSLSEYFHLFKKGKVYSTNVNGKSLLDILKEYHHLKRETMVKKQEDWSRREESAITLGDSIINNKDSVENIVKDAVDHAFHQYFPSICKSKVDTCDDCMVIDTDETEKSRIVSENVTDLCGHNDSNMICNETVIELDVPDKNISCASPKINISEVTSLGDVNSFKKVTEFKNDSPVPSKSGSVNILDALKIEIDNDVTVINTASSTQDKNVGVCNDAIQCQEFESMDSCNVDDELDIQNKFSSISRKGTNISESSDLLSKLVKDVELEYLDNSDNCSDHKNIGSNKIEHRSIIQLQNSVTPSNASLCDSNNLDVEKTSSLSTQNIVIQGDNVINTLNSSNNQSAFIISSNSLPNQCGTFPLSTVPAYILSNYTSNNCFLRNNAPYQLVINSPNGIPLSLPGVPNITNPTLTPTDSAGNIIGKPLIPPASANKVSSTSASVPNNKVSEAVTVDEKDSRERKREKTTEKKGNGKKKGRDTQDHEPSNRPKRKYNRPPKRPLHPLLPPPPVNYKTPVKNSQHIPVISIPEVSHHPKQSSALKLLSQITGQVETCDKSPVLKAFFSNAAVLSRKSPCLSSAHVRCLDFTLNSDD